MNWNNIELPDKEKKMIFQDANQSNKYWCFGKVPPPTYVTTSSGGYWLWWILATTTAE